MIEVKNLTKTFKKPVRGKGLKGMLLTLFSRKYETKVAVDNVSFTINDGEIVGYIGSNGAGKSTTIKMMSGILTPTAGQVLIDGLEPYDNKSRRKVLQNVGVIFGQRSTLWYDLPLRESFELLKEIYSIPDKEYEERFEYLSSILGLNEFITSPVRTLSLGQRMRADIGSALIHNPKILFLDEPTIGLDVLVKQKLISAIKEIQSTFNTTIILTTHDMQDIEELCSRVIILDNGKILYDDSLEKIKKTFGDIRCIEVSLKENCSIDEFCTKYPDLAVEKKDMLLKVTFDNEKNPISEVIKILFDNLKINDIKIAESSIENVVAKIYKGVK